MELAENWCDILSSAPCASFISDEDQTIATTTHVACPHRQAGSSAVRTAEEYTLLRFDDPLQSQKIADADRLKMQNLHLNKFAEIWLQKKLSLELLWHSIQTEANEHIGPACRM